jgi:hypothetical protein
VFDGLAIYNWLRGQDCTVQVDGLAASISSIIALAGKSVCIAENAFFMVHNPIGMAWGEADDMRKTADLLDQLGTSLASTYARETGQPVETCQAWMNDETWFSAEDAVKCGLADKCGPQMSFSASVGRFVKPPSALLGGAAGSTNKPAETTDHSMKNLLQALYAAGIVAKADLDEGTAAQEITNSFTALRKERDGFKNQLDAIAEKEITTTVEAAIADGRIEASAKTEWLTKIKADAGASKLLAGLKPKADANEPLNRRSNGTTKEEIIARYQAIQHPAEKQRFYNQHREVFLARF